MDKDEKSLEASSPILADQSSSHEQHKPAEDSPKSFYERFLLRLKDTRIIAFAMVFSAGVAGSTTLLENLEKLWLRVHALVASDQVTRTFRGRLHEFSDSQRPVKAASVMLGLSDTATSSTNQEGEFSFVIPEKELSSRVLLSVRAPGYAPFDFPRLQLSVPFEKLEIPLSPLVDPGPKFGQPDVALHNSPVSAADDGDPLDFHSFEFIYTFDPPGPRRWTRIEDRLWIEIYGDDRLSFFPVIRSETIDACRGTIVAKSPITAFDPAHRTITFNRDATVQQIFIPGRQCNPLWLRFRHPPSQEWQWLQQMTKVK